MAGSQPKLCSQGLDPEWITIPLEKFSSAVSPLEARTHQWVHDSRRDELFLVFRPERLSRGNGIFEKTTLMIVLAGGDILERQNANELAAIAEDFKDGVQKGLLDPSLEAPVHVVIKSPCVAVRYPVSSSSVRRIQMKFQSDSDYQRATDIFRQHHFPVRSAGVKSNSTISETLLRPTSTNVIQSSSTYDRYGASKSPTSIAVNQAPRTNNSNNTERTRPRPFSSTESRFFVDPPTASSDTVRPSSAWSMSSARRSDASSLTTRGSFLARPGSALEPYGSFRFEKRADLVSAETPYRAFNSELQTPIQDLVDQNSFYSRSKTADTHDMLLVNAQKPFKAVDNSAQYVGTAPFRRVGSAYSAPQISRHDDSSHFDRRALFLPDFSRPGSAPVSESQPHFSQLIPPKRELPFPKIRATTKSGIPAADTKPVPESSFPTDTPKTTKTPRDIALKSSTSALTHYTPQIVQCKLVPIPATSHVSPEAPIIEHCTEAEVDSSKRPGGSTDVEEISPLAPRSAAIANFAAAPDLLTKTASTASRKRANETMVELTPCNKHAKRTVDRSTQTKTVSGRDHTAAHSLNLGTQQSFSDIIEETCVRSVPQDFMNEIDNFVSRHKNRPPPQEIWEKFTYTEATPEERQAIVNDFICENLDNEDFLKLCEDTAEVWRRIGLEM